MGDEGSFGPWEPSGATGSVAASTGLAGGVPTAVGAAGAVASDSASCPTRGGAGETSRRRVRRL